jgi:hypothetical protein
VHKTALTFALAAVSLTIIVSGAEAGGGGLATGLFFGAIGGQIIDQNSQADQRRKAYEADQIRKERAIAARRAAAAQQARAAEYQRIQQEKANAANSAAAQAAADSPKLPTSLGDTTAVAPKDDMSTTTVIAKSPTPLSTPASPAEAVPTATRDASTNATSEKTNTPLSAVASSTEAADPPAPTENTAPLATAPSSTATVDIATCRKYSAAIGGMVDTPCP